jgi:hypothetical protein
VETPLLAERENVTFQRIHPMAVRRYELVWLDGKRASVTVRSDGAQAIVIAIDGAADRLFGVPRGRTEETSLIEELRFVATRDAAGLGVVDVMP